MTQAGPNNPSASLDGGQGAYAWSNVGNIFSSNDARATALSTTAPGFTNLLVAKGFGFAIPANAKNIRLRVSVEHSYVVSGANVFQLQKAWLWYNGAVLDATQKTVAINPTTSDTVVHIGHAEDDWNNALIPKLVNHAEFGIALQWAKTGAGSTPTMQVDHVQLTLWYEVEGIDGNRITVEVFSPGGAGTKQGSGPVSNVMQCEIADRIDKLGSFKLTIPAMDDKAALLTQGREVRIHRDGEGEIFRGIVEGRRWEVRGALPVLIVDGPDLLAELVYYNTQLGRQFDNRTPTQVISADANALLAGTGWTAGSIDGGLKNLTARFDGLTRWAALLKIAQINNVHLRRNGIARSIDYGAFGASSGIVLMNAADIGVRLDGDNAGLVESITVEEEGAALVNSIIPLGSGEANNQFALGDTNAAGGSPKVWSTRSVGAGDPYNISTGTGPNGKAYYYLEDAASVAAYGRRQKVLVSKDTLPIANSAAAFQNAANALYDLAATYLQRFKDPQTVYTVTVARLSPDFEPGDTMRLIYRGVAEDSVTSRTSWLSVDQNVIVLEKARSFDQSGEVRWKLKVATIARWLQDDQELLIGALETLDVFRTGVKFYTMSVSHGTERESIDTGHNYDYSIWYDANVARVLKTNLRVRFRVLKSNVSVVGNEGAHTHTVNLSTHTHSLNGSGTDQPASGTSYQVPSNTHEHRFMSFATDGPSTTHFSQYDDGSGGSGKWFAAWRDGGAGQGDFFTAATGTWATGNVSDVSHTHSLSGRTSAGGNETAKTSSAGTSHNHALTYGIFEAGSPSTFQTLSIYINGVDRSAALGGPWSSGTSLSLDITQYVTDSDGHPLRQENVVQFRTASATAYDVVAHATSLLAASALEAA